MNHQSVCDPSLLQTVIRVLVGHHRWVGRFRFGGITKQMTSSLGVDSLSPARLFNWDFQYLKKHLPASQRRKGNVDHMDGIVPINAWKQMGIGIRHPSYQCTMPAAPGNF